MILRTFLRPAIVPTGVGPTAVLPAHGSRRTLVSLLVVGLVLGITATSVAQISITPESPSSRDPLTFEINAVCCEGGVTINGSAIEVEPGLIRIVTDRTCGPWAALTPYSHAVTSAPVPAGEYLVEYWVTGTCPNDDEPEFTTELVVSHPTFEIVVPGVANTLGEAGTHWTSELELANRSAEPITFEIDLLASGQDNSNPATSGPHILFAKQRVHWDNPLLEHFAAKGTGALRLRGVQNDGDGESLLVLGRTSTTGDCGELGQILPSVRWEGFITPGAIARLVLLSQNEETRTNLGLLNGVDHPIEVTLRFGWGNPPGNGEVTVQLQPHEHRLITHAFTWVTDDQVDVGWVDAWTETGHFYCYASVVRNLSGDPMLVRPEILAAP